MPLPLAASLIQCLTHYILSTYIFFSSFHSSLWMKTFFIFDRNQLLLATLACLEWVGYVSMQTGTNICCVRLPEKYCRQLRLAEKHDREMKNNTKFNPLLAFKWQIDILLTGLCMCMVKSPTSDVTDRGAIIMFVARWFKLLIFITLAAAD